MYPSNILMFSPKKSSHLNGGGMGQSMKDVAKVLGEDILGSDADNGGDEEDEEYGDDWD